MLKKFLPVLVMSTVILICGMTSAQAANVLYWSDYDLGTNPFPTAMTQLGLTFDTASDISDFNTKLATGNYPLAVLFFQNYGYDASGSLSTYLGNGGKVIFTDWTRDSAEGSLFDITYTSSTNQTPVTLTADFLKNGIGDTLNLSNPGWGIWSMGMALNGAQSGATFPNGNVAVAYTSNTIINGMLSDTFADSSEGLQFAKNELMFLTADPAVTPEPASLSLLGFGLIGLAGRRLRKTAK